MKPNDYILYKGKEYPLYVLDIRVDEEKENMTLGLHSLWQELCKDFFNDREAQRVYEQIILYIPDGLADKSEQEIIDYVQKNFY